MATVLIIDDELAATRPLADYIRSQGHQAICVDTAEAALPHLRQLPDLVLLDLSMPGFDGFDVLNALADDARYDEVPVVILSGNADPTVIAKTKQLGARDFIYKGLGWPQICTRVERHLVAIEEEEEPLEPLQA